MPPLARRRRSPPGFTLPCQPTLAASVPAGLGWIHEVKWDGYRIVAVGSRLWSRNALDWSREFPLIVEGMLTVPTAVIDGEAVCLRDDGTPDFRALRSKLACRRAVLMAFDLLALGDVDMRPLPLLERRAALRSILRHPGLRLSEDFEDGVALLRHTCAMGLEGIISKKATSRYKSGRTRDWLKIKCPGYAR